MLPIKDLAALLRRFYGSVRKSDGTKYSKASLNSLRAGLQRHIAAPPFSRAINLLTNVEFHSANNVFKGDLKRKKREGGDKSTSYPPISDGDLERLHDSKVLNTTTPDGLQKLVWFNIQYKLCRHGREGQRTIKKDDFEFKIDDVGREYACLKYLHAQKNHKGDSVKDKEERPVMYGTGGQDCPLAALKLYISKLNPKCDAFFQQPKRKWKSSDICWYHNIPVGINTLGAMMKSISKAAKLSVIYTNHSIRATVLTVLNDSGSFSNRTICSLSGHRNPTSLQSYCKASFGQKRSMSDRLQEAVGKSKRASQASTQAPCTISRAPDSPPSTRMPIVRPSSSMTIGTSNTASIVTSLPERTMQSHAVWTNPIGLQLPVQPPTTMPTPTTAANIRPTGGTSQLASIPSFFNCNMSNASFNIYFGPQ